MTLELTGRTSHVNRWADRGKVLTPLWWLLMTTHTPCWHALPSPPLPSTSHSVDNWAPALHFAHPADRPAGVPPDQTDYLVLSRD